MMSTSSEMAAKLDRLWTKFLPEIEQRVAVLDTTARALAANELSEEQRAAAHAAAHKLAGSLGTFGLQRGTEIAREAEQLLETMDADAEKLVENVGELRAIIQAKG